MKGRHTFHCSECGGDFDKPCKKDECRNARRERRKKLGLLAGAPIAPNFTWAKPYVEFNRNHDAFLLSLFEEVDHHRYLPFDRFRVMILEGFEGEENAARAMTDLGNKFIELGHALKDMAARERNNERGR